MSKLLQAIINLTRAGGLKNIEQVYKVAKRELGDKFNAAKKQIDDAFKKGQEQKKLDDRTKDVKKIDEQGIKSIETEQSQLMKGLEEKVKNLQNVENFSTGLTRTIAREILLKRGINVPKGRDAIELFREKFGQDVLIDINNLAEELLEMDRMGKRPKPLTEIIEQEGFFDVKMPNEPPQGYTPEELAEIQKEIEQEDLLLKFDPTGRKANATGGIMRANYKIGSGLKLAKFLASKGKNLKDEIKKAVDNIFPTGDSKYDADVAVDSMLEELDVDRDMFDQKDIIDAYGMAYDNLVAPITKNLKTPKGTRPTKPEKSIKSMKETGSMDISDPEIASEFDRFIKETDPEGYKKMEEAMKKAADEAQPLDYVLGTRKKNSEGGPNYSDGLSEITELFEKIKVKNQNKRAEKKSDQQIRYRKLIESNQFPELNEFFQAKLNDSNGDMNLELRMNAQTGGPFTQDFLDQRRKQSVLDFRARQGTQGSTLPGTGYTGPGFNFSSPATGGTTGGSSGTQPGTGSGTGGTSGVIPGYRNCQPNTGVTGGTGTGTGTGTGSNPFYGKGNTGGAPRKFFEPKGGSGGGGGKTSAGFDFDTKGSPEEFFKDKDPLNYYKAYAENYLTNRNPLSETYGAISPNQIFTDSELAKIRSEKPEEFEQMYQQYNDLYKGKLADATKFQRDLAGLTTEEYLKRFEDQFSQEQTADDMAMYDRFGNIQNLNPEFYNEDGSLKYVLDENDQYVTARSLAGLDEGVRDKRDFVSTADYLELTEDEIDKLKDPFKTPEQKEADYNKKLDKLVEENPADDSVLEAIATDINGTVDDAKEEYKRRIAESYGLEKPGEDTREDFVQTRGGGADQSIMNLAQAKEIREIREKLGFENITERSSKKQKRSFLRAISDFASKFKVPITIAATLVGGPQGGQIANQLLSYNEAGRKVVDVSKAVLDKDAKGLDKVKNVVDAATGKNTSETLETLSSLLPGGESPDLKGTGRVLTDSLLGEGVSDLIYGMPENNTGSASEEDLTLNKSEPEDDMFNRGLPDFKSKGGRVHKAIGGPIDYAQRARQSQADFLARQPGAQPPASQPPASTPVFNPQSPGGGQSPVAKPAPTPAPTPTPGTGTESLMEGFSKYMQTDPYTGPSTADSNKIRFPDGTVMDNVSSTTIERANKYLKSIGQPPVERMSMPFSSASATPTTSTTTAPQPQPAGPFDMSKYQGGTFTGGIEDSRNIALNELAELGVDIDKYRTMTTKKDPTAPTFKGYTNTELMVMSPEEFKQKLGFDPSVEGANPEFEKFIQSEFNRTGPMAIGPSGPAGVKTEFKNQDELAQILNRAIPFYMRTARDLGENYTLQEMLAMSDEELAALDDRYDKKMGYGKYAKRPPNIQTDNVTGGQSNITLDLSDMPGGGGGGGRYSTGESLTGPNYGAYKTGGRVGLESGGLLGALGKMIAPKDLDLMTIKATLNQVHTNNDDGKGGGMAAVMEFMEKNPEYKVQVIENIIGDRGNKIRVAPIEKTPINIIDNYSTGGRVGFSRGSAERKRIGKMMDTDYSNPFDKLTRRDFGRHNAYNTALLRKGKKMISADKKKKKNLLTLNEKARARALERLNLLKRLYTRA